MSERKLFEFHLGQSFQAWHKRGEVVCLHVGVECRLVAPRFADDKHVFAGCALENVVGDAPGIVQRFFHQFVSRFQDFVPFALFATDKYVHSYHSIGIKKKGVSYKTRTPAGPERFADGGQENDSCCRGRSLSRVISPASDWFISRRISSGLCPWPRRNISLVTAASTVLSYPLVTPASSSRRPFS